MTLKTRVIPILYIKNGFIVRSEGFSYHQNIGNVVNETERYNQWNLDELVCIDISRSADHDARRDDHKVKSISDIGDIFAAISRICFMPLAIGGGIRRLDEIGALISAGCEKVILNTGAIDNPELIRFAAGKHGSQAIVMSVDYRVKNGTATVFSNHGEHDTGMPVMEWLSTCEHLGAGEILLNCIDCDGAGSGFDIDTIEAITSATTLPMVAAGGAGEAKHFIDLAKRVPHLSGIAAGNYFHFTERAYPRLKQSMFKEGINVRAA